MNNSNGEVMLNMEVKISFTHATMIEREVQNTGHLLPK